MENLKVILTKALENDSAIKLEICNCMDSYFGKVKEVNNQDMVIEHFDCMETVNLKDITDTIII